MAAGREYRSLGAKVTLVVHEMKRLGRGALELLKGAEELRDAEIELEFLTDPLVGKHDPAGRGAALLAFFAAMAESERDYIRDKTLEGQETAHKNGEAIGGVEVSDEDMLATALRLRDQEHRSLRETASRLVISTEGKRGSTQPRPPSCGCCASTTSRRPRPRWNPHAELGLNPLALLFSARTTGTPSEAVAQHAHPWRLRGPREPVQIACPKRIKPPSFRNSYGTL
ncbi:recombinase family protein [Streptomyces mirabilis]|uniref:recombinase family protein n=1 Tax=Streptomyces mirabilis TaxID=68239 RepID=UPI00225A2F7C|nr:recombinase family protein [Streptomyces mirabilis]MCX4608723.1 recombinase family protein [Streptomyces mirabilis]